MAAEFLTLADLVKINDMNLADLEVTDLLDDAPFMKALAAQEASNGTDHKYLKETGAPVVGFRDPNDGRENKKSTDTLVTINLKILDASFSVDMALANAYKKGPEAYVAREAWRHLKAAFFLAEQQFINGTGVDSDGFEGLIDAAILAYKDSAMVVDATGSTANGVTSAYLVRTNTAGTDVSAITGQDGEIEVGETTVIEGAGSTTGTLPKLYTPITGWLGMQIGSAYSVARICNIDGSKPLTDDLVYSALSKFPAGRKPNLLVCNGDARELLRKSRTATNQTGAPAPLPETVGPCTVVETDAIVSTEAVLGATP